MTTKSIFRLACVAVAAIGLLAACSGGEGGSTKNASADYPVTKKDYDNIVNTHTDFYVISALKDLDSKGITLKGDLDGDGKEERVTARIGNQAMLEIMGYKGEYGTPMQPVLGGLLEEYNSENDSTTADFADYYVQLSACDLDGDGRDEVIVAMGDKSLTNYCAIYTVRDADTDSFKLVGEIDGMTPLSRNPFSIDENKHVLTPYGSQGLYEEYIYDKGTVFKAQ